MDKQTLQNQLIESHRSFSTYLDTLTKEEYDAKKNNKWSPAQQLNHIIISVKPVRQALGLPKFILKLLFGKANRASLHYEKLVKKYQKKLENGGKAPSRFIPSEKVINRGLKQKASLKREIDTLVLRLDQFDEKELDTLILPHPLLGKLTLRELLYFTIYHVKHHEDATKHNFNEQ